MNKYRGFTLIEVLISIALMMIMTIILQTLHLIAMRQAKITYYYTQASSQLLWLVRAIQQNDKKFHPTLFKLWQQKIKTLLPKGIGEQRGQTLLIRWGKQALTDCTETRIGLSGCIIYQSKKNA